MVLSPITNASPSFRACLVYNLSMNEGRLDVEPNEMLIKKENITNIFAETAVELGTSDKVEFTGFFYEDSLVRAQTIVNKISFNEKYIDLDTDEIKRWSYHENQHALNQIRFDEICDDPKEGLEKAKMIYAFVLHPSYKDLHDRVMSVYNKGIKNGLVYAKSVKPLVAKYSDITIGYFDYADPSEILALLRGYECYLKQLSEGKNPKTSAPELTEAFIPEDLKFLDEVYRKKLFNEINPESLKSKIGKKVQAISLEES